MTDHPIRQYPDERREQAETDTLDATPAEPPCYTDPTCTCIQVNAAGRCECTRWETGADTVTPSRRAGLRDEIARAIHRYDHDHLLSRNDIPSKHHRGEAAAVLAVLYREWPWLRAEAEETAPAATEATRTTKGN